MARFEVEFYEKENGEQPTQEFLLSLDKKMRAKMLMIIGVLQNNGYELREPYSKPIFLLCGSAYYPDERFYQEDTEDTTPGN